MSPDLSIVVFTRNDVSHLRRCLRTLVDSPSSSSIEVVVVDNASTDDTRRCVEDFSDELAVQCIPLQQDSAFSVGNNRGLELAQGELVLFLNPDTIPWGPVIDRCAGLLRSRSDAGLVGPALRYPDGTDQPNGWVLPSLGSLLARHALGTQQHQAAQPGGVTEVGWLMGCFLMGRRDFLTDLGGFDERFWFHGTDLELCARVVAAGRTVLRVDSVELVHVGHPQWDSARRESSHAALSQWFARDRGVASGRLVGTAARLLESLRT